MVTKKSSEILVFVNSPFHTNHLSNVIERLNQSEAVILVDGGCNQFCALLDLCKENKIPLNVSPKCLIGDFDSVTPESYTYILNAYPSIEVIKHPRNKDFTDLESALQYIQSKYPTHLIKILTSLNNRIDHALGNILCLYRSPYQGQVSILTPDEEIVVNDPKEAFFQKRIINKHIKTIGLYSDSDQFFKNKEIKKNKSDIALCITSNHNFKENLNNFHGSSFVDYVFGKKDALIQDFNILLSCIEKTYPFYIQGPTEKLFVINSHSDCCFNTLKGQTISLLPLGGPVKGVTTEGLYWGLTNATLDKDFYSISNLAFENKVKLTCSKGSLLCIVNDYIDDHLLKELKLET